MLSTDQVDVLKHLIANEVESIESSAAESSVSNSDASVGIANLLIANPENLQSLSSKQLFHYKTVIEPLIHHVRCDGMIGDHEDGSSSCIGDGYVDEVSLLRGYLLEDMRCQHCIQTADSWFANNP